MAEARQIKLRRQPARKRIQKEVTAPVESTDQLDLLAKNIARKVLGISTAQGELADLYVQAEKVLRESGLEEHSVAGEGTHQMYKAKSNDSTTLDIAAFRELVGDAAFIEIASVAQKDAKELVTGKQWESITKKTKGGLKEAVYRFVLPGAKK